MIWPRLRAGLLRSPLATLALLAPLAGCGPFGDDAVTEAGSLRLVEVATFDAPTYVASPPGDERLFVTERAGTVRVVRAGRVAERPFLDISGDVNTEGEGGLLSIAFAPDYPRSGRLYVYYTDRSGDVRIDGFERSAGGDTADSGSRVRILRLAHSRPNHKGGQLQFGPDGRLYAGFGDGGGGNDPDRAGQDLGVLAAKIVRISPRPEGGYDIPSGNPFEHRSGARPEIFAYGLRNPYRFSFDRETGDLWIGDVGQDAVEEVDRIESNGPDAAPRGGANLGWSAFEGTRRLNRDQRAPGDERPVLEELQADGFCSLIGGYVVRDRSLGDEVYGRYVYGDLCEPAIRLAGTDGERLRGAPTGLSVEQLVSFGVDARSRLYLVSLQGQVYRLAGA